VVVDEHGGVSGVVTTHDLLEAIVGDLADFEGEAQPIVTRTDGSFLVDAGVDIHELFLKSGLDPTSAGPDDEYHSVGGLVFGELGRLPSIGATVEWRGMRFEIVDMDGNRIDRLLVTLLPSTVAAGVAS
jgi:putative hemolysin